MHTPPNCVQGKTCGTSLAPIYFIIFILLVTHVMLNLFILVIIQQFETYYVDFDSPLKKFAENKDIFLDFWIKFTSRYKCTRIKEKQLFDFFKQLPPPIGMPDDTSDANMKK